MRSFTVASLLALVASSAAQTTGFHAINLPGMFEKVPACTTYNIKWTPSASNPGPVVFQLIGGATQQTLVEIGDRFGSVDGSAGSLAWDVPCDEGDKAVYGLKILLQADTSIMQYSMPFYITPKDGGYPTPTPSTSDPVATMNTTMTSDASSTCDTSTISSMSSNMTYTPGPPTIITSTTFVPDTTADPVTSATGSPVPTAGANRILGGSFAAVAIAAAAFAL